MTTPKEIAKRLQEPVLLRRTSVAVAALDSILVPDPRFQIFHFDPAWRPNVALARMDDGSGNQYAVAFTDNGTLVRGFDHESDMSPWTRLDGLIHPGLLTDLPSTLRWIIDEPQFQIEGEADVSLTFCFWRLLGDDAWGCGAVDDDGGAGYHLAVLLDGTPDGFREFALENYERELGLEIEHAFALEPIDRAFVQHLHPEADVESVLGALVRLGYPGAS